MPPLPMKRRTRDFVGSLLFLLYCTVVGSYLVLRPWAPDAASASPYLRGFLSGLGLLHILAGLADLRGMLARREGQR